MLLALNDKMMIFPASPQHDAATPTSPQHDAATPASCCGVQGDVQHFAPGPKR